MDAEYNIMRDEGCLWLTKCSFPDLRKLLLTGNSIYDRGLKHLVLLNNWKELTELSLSTDLSRQPTTNSQKSACATFTWAGSTNSES
jgi:hypothetical protein